MTHQEIIEMVHSVTPKEFEITTIKIEYCYDTNQKQDVQLWVHQWRGECAYVNLTGKSIDGVKKAYIQDINNILGIKHKEPITKGDTIEPAEI